VQEDSGIAGWETSGNMDGQQKEGEPNFGHIGEMILMDDDRRNFLCGNKQHLLYFGMLWIHVTYS
jgi:hypothetical protein